MGGVKHHLPCRFPRDLAAALTPPRHRRLERGDQEQMPKKATKKAAPRKKAAKKK